MWGKIDDYRELMDVSYLDIPVRELSLGQKMICDVLLIMLHDPEMLFLDEATIALDVYNRNLILDMISQINKKMNITMIITSHLLGDIETVCKNILLLNKGELLYNGSLKNFLQEENTSRTIIVEYKDVSSLEFQRRFFVEIHDLQTRVSNSTLTINCPRDSALIKQIVDRLASDKSVSEFSIRNISLEEKILGMNQNVNV
jgi:ABC-2 type transport system ATP-binding protein